MLLYQPSEYKHPDKETSYSPYSHYVFKKLVYILIRYINLNRRKKAKTKNAPLLSNLVSDPDFMDWSRTKITFLLKENKRNYIKVILVIRDPHSIKMQSNKQGGSSAISSSYQRVNKKYKIKLGSILTDFKKK